MLLFLCCQMRFPFVPGMGGPLHPGMTPNGAPYNLSQPPSEPQEGGPSASQTPDSENEVRDLLYNYVCCIKLPRRRPIYSYDEQFTC